MHRTAGWPWGGLGQEHVCTCHVGKVAQPNNRQSLPGDLCPWQMYQQNFFNCALKVPFLLLKCKGSKASMKNGLKSLTQVALPTAIAQLPVPTLKPKTNQNTWTGWT